MKIDTRPLSVRRRMRGMAWSTIALIVALTTAVVGSLPALAAADEAASPEKLEQLVAPIALYPDPLLMNVLMAATYPLEVVQADRWIQDNTGLTGAKLDAALKSQTWDDSIKSLTKVPDVLTRMSKNLDWTTDLGDVFLAQQADVLDAVQRMRQHASKEGNLATTEQQQVIVEKEIITIVPADPQIIYVPVYSAPVVYGSYWSYPTYYYPPMYAYPPGYVAGASLISFGVGVAVGAAVWGSAGWGGHGAHCCGGWGGHDVDININRGDVNIGNNIGNKKWEHKPEHRRGVEYRDQRTRQKFEGRQGGQRELSRQQARGYQREGASLDRARSEARGQQTKRSAASSRTAQQNRGAGGSGAVQSGSRQGASRAAGGKAQRPTSTRSSNRGGAFGGGHGGGFENAASARGASSRGRQTSASRSRGSASRGGGSRGGGGGGRRGGGGGRRR